jgi:hypothetical protein
MSLLIPITKSVYTCTSMPLVLQEGFRIVLVLIHLPILLCTAKVDSLFFGLLSFAKLRILARQTSVRR